MDRIIDLIQRNDNTVTVFMLREGLYPLQMTHIHRGLSELIKKCIITINGNGIQIRNQY